MTTSSNVRGSSIWENNAKTKNEIGVSASYISHRLLVFIGFVDVDLLKLVDGIVDRVCWSLNVLVGVAWVMTCVEVPCAGTS